jgi:DNA helicase-2/ATP-dependent DNA helicase PcrA
MDFSSHQIESMNQSLIHKSKYFQIDYETELNEEQHKVVFADEGPLLVIAGAGSGKTRTITYRVARLIEQGVNPENILLATFTNKAAREMLHRVECLLGLSLNRMWGGTFHHIGNLILRREAKKVGFDFNYTILDREDQKDLVETCILQSGVDTKARRFPKADVVMQVINLCRNTLVSIEDIIDKNYPQFREWTGNISHIFALYQNRKRELNCMDFDDLLSYVWELFQKDEATRRKYAQMFHHVLVDEYQDTNLIQAEIVDFFASEYRNVLAVGDDSQSIYSFRGANFANIMDFPKKYPDCVLFKLETNYRSVPPILELANQVIAKNTRQYKKTLQAVRKSGEKPVVVPARNTSQQSEFVATQILTIRDNGYSLRDIAILYRAHYQSMELQMELTRRGIPFEVRSGLRFFEQAHIKDIVAYLKVIANPRDEIAWKRVLKIYPGIGKATSEKIWEFFRESVDPLGLIQKRELPENISRGAREGLLTLEELLSQLEEIDFQPGTMIQKIIQGSYNEYLTTHYPDYRERLQDIEELANFASQYKSLDDFLSELALLGDMEAENIVDGGLPDEKVTLSSVHQAKGLEWPVVFVIWLCEGGFPSGRSIEKEEDIEEDRRLFYVACTRAKDYLFLCYPIVAEGNRAQTSFIRKPSRFLKEIDSRSYTKWLLDRSENQW